MSIRYTIISRFAAATALLIISCANLNAGPELDPSRDVWLNFGVGAGFGRHDFAMIDAVTTLSFQLDEMYYISFRGLAGADCFSEGCGDASAAWELGGMFGLFNRTEYSLLSVAAGLSWGMVVNEPEYTTSAGENIGLPVEVQAFLLYKHVGLGAYLFGNINARATYFGADLCLQILF